MGVSVIGPLSRVAGLIVLIQLGALSIALGDDAKTSGAGVESTRKTSWTAQLVRKKGSDGGITGLGFSEATLPVTLMPTEGKLRPVITIRGRFSRPGWQLASGANVLVARDAVDPEFHLYAALKARTSEIPLSATGPDGKTETEQLIVLAPDVQEFRVARPWGEIMFSAGAASLGYFQTAYGNFSSFTGILKVGYATPKWKSQWGALGEIWTTLATFSSKPANLGPELIGGDIDLTYALSGDGKNAYQPTLIAGINYLTMISNGSPFGFANLIAPELGVKVAYPLSVDSALTGDFRYVDLASGLVSLSLAGYDFRLAYGTRLTNGHRFELGLDAGFSSYSPDGTSQIRANVISARIGYSI